LQGQQVGIARVELQTLGDRFDCVGQMVELRWVVKQCLGFAVEGLCR
jgi:hypothetical protein